MTSLIVTFSLRPGVEPRDYESWAAKVDIPTVTGLRSVERFSLYRATELFGGGELPYEYVEVITITDMAGFLDEIAQPTMVDVAKTFQEVYAQNPSFVLAEILA